MKKLVLLWAAVIGVACGEVKNAQPDAAIDAGIDAPPDAPPGPVLVTVLSSTGNGAPDVTARVVFQDPQGALVLDAMVDAMGKAQALLPSGGAVTVVRVVSNTPTTHNAILTTITGVKPGDDLVIGLKRRAVTADEGGATQMNVSYTTVAGATYYQFFYACGNGGIVQTAPPNVLAFRDSCHGASFDLLATAQGGTIVPPRFTYLSGVTHTSGGSFTMPFGFTPMTTFTVNATNTPAEVTSISSSRWSLIENSVAARQNGSVSGDPPAGAVTMTMPYAQGVGTSSQVEVTFTRPGVTMQHQVRTATLASSISIDLGEYELPVLTGQGVTRTGATWTAMTPGDAPDGQVLLWSADWTVGAQARSVNWDVIGPASLTGQPLPRLAAVLAEYDPAAQTVAVRVKTAVLYMANYDVVAGYDGFRQMAETLVLPQFEDMGAFVGMPHQRRYMTLILPAM